MNVIVSVTSNWGIGLRGNLLVRNAADMHFFKECTMGGTVICGQTTFLSFPGGALQGRRNIVLSLDPMFKPKDAEVFGNMKDALAAVQTENPETVWVIGGQSIYRQLLSRCTRALVTKNDVVLPADAYFPNLDDDPTWVIQDIVPGGTTKQGIPFEFVTYRHN